MLGILAYQKRDGHSSTAEERAAKLKEEDLRFKKADSIKKNQYVSQKKVRNAKHYGEISGSLDFLGRKGRMFG